MTVESDKLFSRAYNKAFLSILDHKKERYTFTGGRASCKSSFISIVIVLLLLTHKDYNCIVIRKYANTLRRSVFEQIVWAIRLLRVEKYFTIPKSSTTALPIKLIHTDGTEQTIYFSGSDDPEKLKSIKASYGYYAILWTEEKTEFKEEELQNIRISALRGGSTFYIFESFNPPSARLHWCNLEAMQKDKLRLIIHTTYKDIPREWLGEAILHDIAQTKKTNERAYRNIYLGEATGSGSMVFENIEERAISKEEINAFDVIYSGIDWGYYPDCYHFSLCSYNDGVLYIFFEFRLYKHSNIEAFNETVKAIDTFYKEATGEEISNYFSTLPITADSSEPKSIADFKAYGANIRGAIKGVGSREASFKWLQGLNKIVIDGSRCSNTLREFMLYEYEIDKRTGEVITGYPDGQPDHAIDSIRYATERIWRRGGN